MSPIKNIDHLRVGTTDFERSVAAYASLCGLQPGTETSSSGQRLAKFALANLTLCLAETDTDRGILEVCFAVDNIERMGRRLERLGLTPTPTESPTRLSIQQRGLHFSFVEKDSERDEHHRDLGPVVYALDHLVIESANPEHTAFLLAAQLGLDLRMDLSNANWGARLMFFRCGDLIVEVMHKLGKSPPSESRDDSFFGLSWRVADAHAAQQNFTEHGLEVSAVRDGRKPGTQVFTVKDPVLALPTLILQPPARPR
ncbi:MAG: VOC family protein [Congregibacter sp.]